MKRIVLGLSLLVMLAQNIFADKASYMKEYEGSKSVKALYKLLLCEAEAKFYKTEDANPEQCIEAANSILKGEDLGVLSKNKKTYLGEAYFNAGIIYQYKLHNHKQALESYLKAYNVGYCDNGSDCSVGRNIGYYYATGEGGTPLDKIKAYQYFLESAKHGNAGSQRNLDILCKESPWACK